MKASAALSILASLLIAIATLAGCATVGESPKTLAIEHRGEYEGVLVSSASSTVKTAGYEETFIEGKEEANRLIDLLNGQELEKASEADLKEKSTSLEEPGNYRMLLYNTPGAGNENQHMYLILFYKDGTIQVDQEGVAYFLYNPPEDLLSELKQQWNISF